MAQENKIKALNDHLQRKNDDLITEDNINTHDENLFETDEGDFLVLTDEEADERTAEYIEETLWAFNIDFLRGFMPDAQSEYAEEIIKPIQEKCESGNDAIKSLVDWDKNADAIVEEAIKWENADRY